MYEEVRTDSIRQIKIIQQRALCLTEGKHLYLPHTDLKTIQVFFTENIGVHERLKKKKRQIFLNQNQISLYIQ